MPMDPDGKDFLLHLYDKLWENMGAKEGRLWSYLSVYGAAIALSLGVGEYAGAELYAVTIVLALTVWALLIVINANWWYQRNRLMVTQIEKKFVPSGAVDGVVPKSYRDARFNFDRLYRGSVLVLTAIGSMLYLKLMWEHHTPDRFPDTQTVVSIGLLYSLFLMSTMYCVAQYQSYIDSFFSIKKTLLEEAGEAAVADIEKNILDGRKAAYAAYSWSIKGLLLLLFGMATFDFLPGNSNPQWATGLALQAFIVLIYLAVATFPPKKTSRWWRKTWLIQLVGLTTIAASAVLFLQCDYQAARLAQKAKSPDQSPALRAPIWK